MRLKQLSNKDQFCDEFEKENLLGEGNYHVILGKIIKTKEFSKNKINYLMSLCSDITNPVLESEFYFVISDELSFLRPVVRMIVQVT